MSIENSFILATSIGISISDFWDITPYELGLAFKGYKKKKEREAEEYKAKIDNQRDLMFIQAFLISRWVWQKKVDIDKILNMKTKTKKMTDEQMLVQVKALNILFGGEVIDVKAKK